MHLLYKKWKITLTLTTLFTLLIYLKVSSLNNYSGWTTKNPQTDNWVNFSWVDDNIDGRYLKKSAINVYCRVKGFQNTFSFQLDLGAELSGVYENTYASLAQFGNSEIKKLKSPLLFGNHDKFVADLELSFGTYTFNSKKAYVYNEMGDLIKNYDKNDTIHLGTIGRDIFKDKVLLIDYVNHRFKIVSTVPKEYESRLVKIAIDHTGKIVLPVKVNDRKLKITFDSGSSIFQLITSEKNVRKFTTGKDIDTLRISSWGKKHSVTGRQITGPVFIANCKYQDVKLYVNHSGLGIDNTTDGMTGNALFLNQMIIVDFKNQRFGTFPMTEK